MTKTFMLSVMIKKKTKRAPVKDFQTVINWFYENHMIILLYKY